jgi:LPS-assembly lipoprotein
MRRTITTAIIAAIVFSMGLAACGFHLRGEANYPFTTFYLTSSDAWPLTAELRRTLEGVTSAKLVTDVKTADVTLEIESVEDTKQILSLSGGGKVAEYLLAKRVLLRVHDNDGREWLPTSEVLVRRSYTYSDTETLAKEAQEARLWREMQTDGVQQIVRRMQAAKKPLE